MKNNKHTLKKPIKIRKNILLQISRNSYLSIGFYKLIQKHEFKLTAKE